MMWLQHRDLFLLVSQHTSTKSTSQKKRGSIPRYRIAWSKTQTHSNQRKKAFLCIYNRQTTAKSTVRTLIIALPELKKWIFTMSRSKSVEQVMEHVMERHYDFDLTYITERIISVFFLPDLEEQQYRRNLQEVASMLKSKHQDKFLVSVKGWNNNIKFKTGITMFNIRFKQWRFGFVNFFCLPPASKFIREETWHHQTLPKGTDTHIWHITQATKTSPKCMSNVCDAL